MKLTDSTGTLLCETIDEYVSEDGSRARRNSGGRHRHSVMRSPVEMRLAQPSWLQASNNGPHRRLR
jgi:hypothetical protein